MSGMLNKKPMIAFERMWSGEQGDFIARCDFYRDKAQYYVTVFHVPTRANITKIFDMTCWTKPIGNLMETYDCRHSEDLAEEITQELERRLL